MKRRAASMRFKNRSRFSVGKPAAARHDGLKLGVIQHNDRPCEMEPKAFSFQPYSHGI
jgi:hypothetical protein